MEVILRRYEALTKQSSVLESTGETYADLALRRQREAEQLAHTTGNPTIGLPSATSNIGEQLRG